jgi:hypothetical protein
MEDHMADSSLNPVVSRRNALTGVSATVISGVLPAVAMKTHSIDPLYVAIGHYTAGMATFNVIKEKDWAAAGGEEAVIEGTYGAPMRILEEWQQPAQTREGAIEALKLAIADGEWFDASSIASPMMKAALAYLERLPAA